MDIGQIMSNIAGSIKPENTKTLELKVGQIIKAFVLEVLGEKGAMLNIGGTIVKADISTQLMQGQSYFFEVQPPTTDDTVSLKVVQNPNIDPKLSLVDVLKSFNIPATKQNLSFFQQLQDFKIPLDKANMAVFQDLLTTEMAKSPTSLAVSVGIAEQKGLPLTSTTITSVYSAMEDGKGLTQTMTNLQDNVKQLLPSLATDKTVGSTTKLLINQLSNLLSEFETLVKTPNESPSKGNPDILTPKPTPVLNTNLIPSTSTKDVPASTVAITPNSVIVPEHSPQNAQAPNDTSSTSRRPTDAPAAQKLQTTVDVDHPLAIPKDSASVHSSSSPRPEVQTTVASNSKRTDQGKNMQNAIPEIADMDTPAVIPTKDTLTRALKIIGIDHESRLHNIIKAGQDIAQEPSISHNSIKSVLLQLSESKDIPASLKSIVEDGIKTITGQQLLSSNERTNNPYVFTSIVIPLSTQNSNLDTASIHIQAHKDSKGKIDLNNCRLLFDLDMSHLGHTLVDTTIVSKHISLTIFNNRKDIDNLMENLEPSLKDSLNAFGYTLHPVKYAEFVKPSTDILTEMLSDTVKSSKRLDVKI